jgi:choline monooxygenase
MGIVFINLSGDAPEFAQHIDPVLSRWSALAGADFAAQLTSDSGTSGSLELEVHCNYKLAVENYCESYHLPFIHPELNTYSPLDEHYNLMVDSVASGQGTSTYDLERGSGAPLPRFPGWDPSRLKTGEYLSLYPNTLLGIQADHFFAIILMPEAPDRTRERLQFMYAGNAAIGPETERRRQSLHEAWSVVFSEDVSVVEGMQKGRASPGFDGGVFSPLMDVPTHHFHHWFSQRFNQP